MNTCRTCGCVITPTATHCRAHRQVRLAGERNPQHKLTDADVLAIRAIRGETQEQIAKQFNVSRSLI